MRRAHNECANCHEVVHASELSEDECHPVTCAVPAPQVMGDVELLQVQFSTDQTARRPSRARASLTTPLCERRNRGRRGWFRR